MYNAVCTTLYIQCSIYFTTCAVQCALYCVYSAVLTSLNVQYAVITRLSQFLCKPLSSLIARVYHGKSFLVEAMHCNALK